MNFSFIVLISVIVASVSGLKNLNWNPQYTVKGKLHLPLSDIHEPFTAWYDGSSDRSRIDYYDGAVKTYQFNNFSDQGILLRFVPTTLHTSLDGNMCFIEHNSVNFRIHAQPVMPRLNSFTYAGRDTLLQNECDKFVLQTSKGELEKIQSFWVKYDGAKNPIPLRYEVKVYNKVSGTHYQHYYINYNEYKENIENIDDIFHVNPSILSGCYEQFAPVLLNPMSEFIHPVSTARTDKQFIEFMRTHNRLYENDSELEYRRSIFLRNLHFIESMNRANLSFKLKINHLADRTDDEIKAMSGYRPSHRLRSQNPMQTNNIDLSGIDIPEEYDWRLYGAVTPVKDQAFCGSCWAFGSVGALEGAYFLKSGGNLVRFSEQALIDCTWGYGNFGCFGGDFNEAYEWIMKSGGIPTDEEYGPYEVLEGYCHATNESSKVPIKGYNAIQNTNEAALKAALLKYGPIAIAIDASLRTFNFYSHGVYYDPKCSSTNLDHAVLLVGYGTFRGEPYWLVKNSWASTWGNGGYIMISRRNNNCGVMTDPSYVEM